jgi:hypothetical protein
MLNGEGTLIAEQLMPGVLGKCPTCDRPIANTALFCPHCGERKFLSSSEYRGKVKCPLCKGNWRKRAGFLWLSTDDCVWCNKGEVDLYQTIDLRTGIVYEKHKHKYDDEDDFSAREWTAKYPLEVKKG